jgi:hypothetical protein
MSRVVFANIAESRVTTTSYVSWCGVKALDNEQKRRISPLRNVSFLSPQTRYPFISVLVSAWFEGHTVVPWPILGSRAGSNPALRQEIMSVFFCFVGRDDSLSKEPNKRLMFHSLKLSSEYANHSNCAALVQKEAPCVTEVT